MAEFRSELGNKQIKSNMRNFEVSDDSGVQQSQPTQPAQQYPQEQVKRYDFGPPVFDESAMQDFNNRINPPQQQIKDSSDIEKQVLEAKRIKRDGKERLSEGARRRLELLIGMSRLTRECIVDGNMYKLQSLSSKELRQATLGASEFDGTVELSFELRKQLLARSLTMVAGVEIEQFLNSDSIDVKLGFIEELDHALLLRIYKEYVILANEIEEKYTLKTETEAKGALEDLKK